jgi:hypothetical protein
MLDELASGTKILVRKVGQGETDADFARLAKAIARHGPSALLRVDEAGPSWRPEPVLQVNERMFSGRVRRFAPQETAWDVDLEPWIRLCDSAYAKVFGVSEATFYPNIGADAAPFPARLRQHRGKHQDTALTAYTRAVDPDPFSPEFTYVFSTWIWIPSMVTPERIFATAGHERLGAQDADLKLRDCWQRVWATGRFQHGVGPAAVGLGMIGSKRDRFWSRGARLYEGPVPGPDSPPAPLAKGLIGWLRRL